MAPSRPVPSRSQGTAATADKRRNQSSRRHREKVSCALCVLWRGGLRCVWLRLRAVGQPWPLREANAVQTATLSVVAVPSASPGALYGGGSAWRAGAPADSETVRRGTGAGAIGHQSPCPPVRPAECHNRGRQLSGQETPSELRSAESVRARGHTNRTTKPISQPQPTALQPRPTALQPRTDAL